jgi:hypothetical protein
MIRSREVGNRPIAVLAVVRVFLYPPWYRENRGRGVWRVSSVLSMVRVKLSMSGGEGEIADALPPLMLCTVSSVLPMARLIQTMAESPELTGFQRH